MFGRSKPVVFDPYGRRRSRWRMPRWLVLMLMGIALGGAAVVIVQERYLPPRLTASASAQLRSAYEQADAERTRLKGELASTSRQLDAAVAERKRLADDLGASRQTVARLRDDVASLVTSLPPDPRGGAVQVRAARFKADSGTLAYDVVLTRERAGKPISGVLQLVVAGAARRGADTTVTLKPVAISVGSVESVRGDAPLPDGFDPRQATIHVLDRPDGKLLGMRVMRVN